MILLHELTLPKTLCRLNCVLLFNMFVDLLYLLQTQYVNRWLINKSVMSKFAIADTYYIKLIDMIYINIYVYRYINSQPR